MFPPKKETSQGAQHQTAAGQEKPAAGGQPVRPAQPGDQSSAGVPRTPGADAAAQADVGKKTENIRGAWDLPLNEQGRQDTRAAAERHRGQFTEIHAGPLGRHQETARIYQEANPEAGPVRTHSEFGPMAMGDAEGQPVTPRLIKKLNEHFEGSPDKPLPGVGKFSGKPGSVPSQWGHELIAKVQEIERQWKPGDKPVVATSGRNVQAISDWVARGGPDDASVRPDLTQPWPAKPGEMFRYDPVTRKGEMTKTAEKAGIYFLRHEDTAANLNTDVPPVMAAPEPERAPSESVAKAPNGHTVIRVPGPDGQHLVLTASKDSQSGYRAYDPLVSGRSDLHNLQPAKLDSMLGSTDWRAALAEHGLSPENVTGVTSFYPEKNGGARPGLTYVAPEYRRQGLATAMYDAQRAAMPAGERIFQGVQRPDGEQFRKAYDAARAAGEPVKPLSIQESPAAAYSRGLTPNSQIVTVDAKAFQEAFERTHGGPLAWSPERADKLKDLPSFDAYPQVTGSGDRVDVIDGRHRIAEAARRGQEIEVAVAPGTQLPAEVLSTKTPAAEPRKGPTIEQEPEHGQPAAGPGAGAVLRDSRGAGARGQVVQNPLGTVAGAASRRTTTAATAGDTAGAASDTADAGRGPGADEDLFAPTAEAAPAAGGFTPEALLHDRLTAQMKSGGAVKAAKLKPAKTGSLFDEPEPESGNLFEGPERFRNFEDLSRMPAAEDLPRPAAEQRAFRDLFGDERGSFSFKPSGGKKPAVGAILRADVDKVKELISKRKTALETEKMAAADPKEKEFGQRLVEYYTGERDMWISRVNQLLDRLRKMVPGPVERQGLALYRDFKTRPGELQQWLNGTHVNLQTLDPASLKTAQQRIQQLRPAILQALHPTQRMLDADQVLTTIAEASFAEGHRLGVYSAGAEFRALLHALAVSQRRGRWN